MKKFAFRLVVAGVLLCGTVAAFTTGHRAAEAQLAERPVGNGDSYDGARRHLTWGVAAQVRPVGEGDASTGRVRPDLVLLARPNGQGIGG
jgi:hypothetical protein